MSIEVMSWVWKKSQASGTDKFVLLAIADNAWDDGTHAWPSVHTIMRKTGLSERTVQRCIQNLCDMGELKIVDRPGHSNLYSVIMKQQTEAKEQKPEPVKAEIVKVEPEIVKAEKIDEIWEATMLACGVDSRTINSQERGRHNKAVKALKESGATPQQIIIRARQYKIKFKDAPLTPIALASHWSELDPSIAQIPSAEQVPQGFNAIKEARARRQTNDYD